MAETIRLDQGQLSAIEAATKNLQAANVAGKVVGDAARALLSEVRSTLRDRDKLARDLGLDRTSELDRRVDQIESTIAGASGGAKLGSLAGPAGRVAGAVLGGLGGIVVGDERRRFQRENQILRTDLDDRLFRSSRVLREIFAEQERRQAEARARRDAEVNSARKVR